MKLRPIHAGRLERYLGADVLQAHAEAVWGWHGPPIALLQVPGNVRVTADGDFVGSFEHGAFACFRQHMRDMWRRTGQVRYGMAGVGFATLADALDAQKKKTQRLHMYRFNGGSTINFPVCHWLIGGHPPAGAAGAAAPGGTACSSATAGCFQELRDPASGTMHLTGASLQSEGGWNITLLYDKLFSVAKTMSSSSTEAVTGVPTRYQSTTAGAEDYAGGNFLSILVTTTLSNTAHNWTVCQYTDQDGNTGATLPSVTGANSCPANRPDINTNQWFCPLAADDTGIKALTQMQCSAATVTGGVEFFIGHPIGFSFGTPSISSFNWPRAKEESWLIRADQAPRVYDSACLTTMNIFNQQSSADTVGWFEITYAS
jgi:hypothetical protein